MLEFIREYVLDLLYITARHAEEDNDLVTVITIHLAKGTEREICYVLNVSPQSFPTSFAIGNADKVEEERRVLYVALTRAKNELIITRHCPTGNGGFSLWARTDDSPQEEKTENYFLYSLPHNLLEEPVHQRSYPPFRNVPPASSGYFHF